MTPAIWHGFEKLETQKQKVLADVGRLSAAQLRFRPEPTAWSVSDVLDHLVKVEKALLGAVQDQLPDGTLLKFKDRVGTLFIIAIMQSPVRVKVPSTAAMVLPEATADTSETAMRWSQVREEMADMLRSLRPEQLRCGLFRHPVSGWMTMAQALKFLSAHLRHHDYQLNRLKSASRKL
jgi:uncharacterized damage-inducible protein DinB